MTMKSTLLALLLLRTSALSTRGSFSAQPEELHAPSMSETPPDTAQMILPEATPMTPTRSVQTPSTRGSFSAQLEELHAPSMSETPPDTAQMILPEATPTTPTRSVETPTTQTKAVVKRTGLKLSVINLASQMDVVVRSFCVVGVAEIFDKTWFVALICALSYGKKISFIGGSLALALHVFLAAGLGVTISQFFSIRTLCFSTAAIFFLLAMAYTWEFFSSEVSDDVIAERSNEAQESMKGDKDKEGKGGPCWRDALGRVFMAVFVAEWGDRTQVAMITLHSSAPWLPVCLGSLVAFLLLTFSAVVAATLVQHAKLSERFVLGVSALSFFVFSALAVRDGYMAPMVRGAPRLSWE